MTANAPVRILIVDDEEQIRTLLRTFLTKEGYAVSEASNSAQTRAILESTPVDLMTLDLNLGGEDGLALARELRAKRDIPIIMISAKADEIDRVVGLELGADDYITKPFNLREVLARCGRAGATASGAAYGSAAAPHERYIFGGMILVYARRISAMAGASS
jgi:DNA-binding response OmpR family regulator